MISPWLRVYRFATGALAPFAARRLARAAEGDPALVARQPERRGHVPDAEGELWIHAASVGELNAAEPLVRALLDGGEDRIVLTTLTHTAAEEARRRFVNRDALRHLFAPLDTVASVTRWLAHTRPCALLLVETEIWPVMLDACRRRSIPVAIVNARISSRAMRRYSRFAGLFREALSWIDPVLCQDETGQKRFESLGVDPGRIRVTGNLKCDVDALAAPTEEMLAWQQRWSGRPVWVAGSTHAAEEPILARAHRRLLKDHPDALALIVPRHPERGAQSLEALQNAGLVACMIDEWGGNATGRSNNDSGRQSGDIEANEIQAIVIDRMGVLAGLYQLADACVVCGSLVEGIGGHNLIEPALAGKPILTGVHTTEQQAAAAGLEASDGLVRVDSEAVLAERLAGILEDHRLAGQLAARAIAFANGQRGALAATLDALADWLRVHRTQGSAARTKRTD